MIEATSCGGVVIFRGKILLLYKSYKNKYEGWVLPKGTVEAGEEYKDTAAQKLITVGENENTVFSRGCHGSDRGKSDPGQRRFKVAEPYAECRYGIPDPCLRTGRKRDQILPYRVCTGTVHQRWLKTGHCKTLSEPTASERQGKGRCDGGRTENT